MNALETILQRRFISMGDIMISPDPAEAGPTLGVVVVVVGDIMILNLDTETQAKRKSIGDHYLSFPLPSLRTL